MNEQQKQLVALRQELLLAWRKKGLDYKNCEILQEVAALPPIIHNQFQKVAEDKGLSFDEAYFLAITEFVLANSTEKDSAALKKWIDLKP